VIDPLLSPPRAGLQHVARGVRGADTEIPFYFFSEIIELAHPPQTNCRTAWVSLSFCSGVFKGTDTQSDGLEYLGDDCNVKVRSRAGLVVSPACEHRQLLAPRAIGKPRDLKGDPASSEGGLRDGDDRPHLLSFALKMSPPPELKA
jgi:hypothetical protein